MKQYEIWTEDFEFRFGKYRDSIPDLSERDIEDLYFDQNSFDPRCVATFDTIKEAEKEFEKNYTNNITRPESTFNGWWILRGDIAYIEEVDYYVNGDYDHGEIVAFSCAPYKKEEKEEDQ